MLKIDSGRILKDDIYSTSTQSCQRLKIIHMRVLRASLKKEQTDVQRLVRIGRLERRTADAAFANIRKYPRLRKFG